MARPNQPLADPGLGLAMAMVFASPTPLILLDGECAVIACSGSFCEAFQIDPSLSIGRSLFDLGQGQWDTPRLRSLVKATISSVTPIDGYGAELSLTHGGPRSIVISVRKLVYGVEGHVRLLLAVADVTEVRASEAAARRLAQDNEVLSREIRHRVANSLQIIASVIMLNARKTSSEEVRGQLRDAHARVMSIADLQRQLAVESGETVNVRKYLLTLCDSITASMIADPKTLLLSVAAEDVEVGSEVSVSIGLIVTEMVINSLKHGFPAGGPGKIKVAYEGDGPLWTLSVTDNGVGMPQGRTEAVAGLGTSIILALGRKLHARVVVELMAPGTKVSLVGHALPGSDTEPERAAPQLAV